MPRRNKTPPHQRFVFASDCDKKRRFASEKAATEAAEYQMLIKPHLTLTAYNCQLCSGWHLTSRPNH